MLHCSHLYLMTKSWSGCFRWKCLARVWVEGNLVHHVQTTWVGTEQGLMRTTNSNYKFLDSRDIHRIMDLGQMNALQVFHRRLSSPKINTAPMAHRHGAHRCHNSLILNNPIKIKKKKH